MNNRSKSLMAAALCLALAATAAVAAKRVRIANEGEIRDQWMLADGVTLAAPGYPAAFAERGDNVCVAMGYSIKPDGTTSDFSLLKAWSSSTQDKEPTPGFWDAFSQASASALSQWKFKPKPEVGTPSRTYTVATMHFVGKQATDAAGLRSNCAIPDLAAYIQQQKADRFATGTIEKQQLENFRRAQQGQSRMNENPGRAATR